VAATVFDLWDYSLTGGQNKRGARPTHKRLSYTFKINRTSLDHLLLGKCADIDKVSNAPSILRSSPQSLPMSRPYQQRAGMPILRPVLALSPPEPSRAQRPRGRQSRIPPTIARSAAVSAGTEPRLDLPAGNHALAWLDVRTGATMAAGKFGHPGRHRTLLSPEFAKGIALKIARDRGE
jgi:hypothetical protein